MEKRFEQIIKEGRKAGKAIGEINRELEENGAGFHLNPDGTAAGWTAAEMAEGFIPAAETPEDARHAVNMRRRPEFAGTRQLQTVSGGDYEVSYDENGYAVKAVRVNG